MDINTAARIIKHRKRVVIIFAIIALISAVAQFFVSVNYNIVDYLPDDAPSTQAMDIMESEFDASIPNTRVMVHEVTVQEALSYKAQLEAIDGVLEVLWLDDVMDLKTPLEMADSETVEAYYKDGKALFSISVRDGDEVNITDQLYEIIGEQGAIAGEALDTATSQKMAGQETMYAAMLLVPMIILILVISTTSWVEPIFFLTAIGVSVIINLGTNIFIGEVSFVTQSVAPILQLAVSLDYAIFLLHSFQDYRKKVSSPEEAMQLAMKKSFPAITASAATTFFGFIALTFMNFEIGADLGLNLVKGILLSYLSVIIFLPALTLMFYKWMDKTAHKSFIPTKFSKLGKNVVKVRVFSLLVVLAIIVPSFLAQSNTSFIYGIGEHPESTRAGADFVAIEEAFGETVQMVVLVPKGDLVKEEALIQDFKEMNHVTSVISYVNMVSSVIPPEYLDETVTNEFFSENYSRIILNTNAGKEGDLAFSLVESVQEKLPHYYDDALILGESVTLYDIKNTVTKDNKVVNILTVLTIGVVLIVTFKSISIPIVLLLTIQSAVWFNLSIPYFTDTSLVFVGYLIVSTVQLAATVDYAILFTETYEKLRKKMSALDAIKKTVNEKTFSISISAAILSSVGFILWLTNSNPIVSSIGLLLGRGALLAFIMVVFFLPAILLVADKIIQKTTYKSNFYEEKS